MVAHVEFYTEEHLPKDIGAMLTAWGQVCFDDDHDITWTNTAHWHVLTFADQMPVSYLGIFERTGTVGGKPVRLGGIGGVMTPPEHRGMGYSSTALEAAAAFMRDRLGSTFGLLVTGPKLIGFYGRLGWRRVPGPIRFWQPDGVDRSDRIDVIMILPLAGEPWPDGPIDLCGLPW